MQTPEASNYSHYNTSRAVQLGSILPTTPVTLPMSAKEAAFVARKERNRLAAAASRARKDAKLQQTIEQVEVMKVEMEKCRRREHAFRNLLDKYKEQNALLRELTLSLGGKLPPNLLLQDHTIFEEDGEVEELSAQAYSPSPYVVAADYSTDGMKGSVGVTNLATRSALHPGLHDHHSAQEASVALNQLKSRKAQVRVIPLFRHGLLNYRELILSVYVQVHTQEQEDIAIDPDI